MKIEDHFSAWPGTPTPMDIEWAKDGVDGRLYIVQARPETVASRQTRRYDRDLPPDRRRRGPGRPARPSARRSPAARARIVRGPDDLAAFRPGEVLVAEMTSPDWQTVMKKAAAIVTDRGGRTCHAAILARELGVPAVVGTGDATARLHDRRDGDGLVRRRRTSAGSEGRRSLRRSSARRSRRPAGRDRGHGQPGRPRSGLPHGRLPLRRRRPGADGVHHQPARRHPPDGAGRIRSVATPAAAPPSRG